MQKPCQTYQQFMLLTSPGLSRAGIERLNDSIRAYVYCLLGAQAQTKMPIIVSYGTESDAQKQFKKLLEETIEHQVNIPFSISRYENAVSNAHIRLDYIIAPGLYIIGSGMVLNVGAIENYNNNILIASSGMKPGRNDINTKKNLAPPLMEGNPVKTYRTKATTESYNVSEAETPDVKAPVSKPIGQSRESKALIGETPETKGQDHENMKFYLFAVMSRIVGLGIYFFK